MTQIEILIYAALTLWTMIGIMVLNSGKMNTFRIPLSKKILMFTAIGPFGWFIMGVVAIVRITEKIKNASSNS